MLLKKPKEKTIRLYLKKHLPDDTSDNLKNELIDIILAILLAAALLTIPACALGILIFLISRC